MEAELIELIRKTEDESIKKRIEIEQQFRLFVKEQVDKLNAKYSDKIGKKCSYNGNFGIFGGFRVDFSYCNNIKAIVYKIKKDGSASKVFHPCCSLWEKSVLTFEEEDKQ